MFDHKFVYNDLVKEEVKQTKFKAANSVFTLINTDNDDVLVTFNFDMSSIVNKMKYKYRK